MKMEISVELSVAADGGSGAHGVGKFAPDEPMAEADLRLIRILQHRGRLVARTPDEASSVQRLVQAGLVRAVERSEGEVILVLSGYGLRLAQSAH
jgi:hypothetical protein